MWADNETDLDLLGFDFLVDGLVVALTEPRLLPLTLGVLGDWGSGKSSLMRIAAAELAKEGATSTAIEGDPTPESRYLTIEFSPWQYEDHADVKVALMNAVLDALEKRVPDQQEEVSRLRSFTTHLKRWSRRAGRIGASSVPAVAPVILQAAAPHIGTLDPTTTELITTAATAASTEAAAALAEPSKDGDQSPAVLEPSIQDVATFRRELADLVDGISGTDAVIVFIDDLDRCLPETVVDTFEAIRLFLNTPKTAYVLALNQQVVESAVDARYPELRKQDGAGIGRDYLEKMLQLKVAIPPLSSPEAETYVNLLFAEFHLADEDFGKVLAKTAEIRASNGLSVAFNAGIASDILTSVPETLAKDLEWAAHIAPVLGSSLRGNPRQLKRFLNNLLLKHRSARRRNVVLDLPVLAKLMVLEDQYNSDFQRIFDWQLSCGEGAVPELATAERMAIDDANSVTPKQPTKAQNAKTTKESKVLAESTLDADVVKWVEKSHIREWLRIEPSLASVDLRPYFTYSRDKLSFGVSASRLAPHLQQLLTQVQSDVDASRRQHCTEVAALDPSERAQFMEALLDRAVRYPSSPAPIAAIEIAELAPDVVQTTCDALKRIPIASVLTTVGTAAVRRLPNADPATSGLLALWSASDNRALARVVSEAQRSKAKKADGGNVR